MERKFLKKTLVLILSLTLFIFLCACRQTDNNSSGEDTSGMTEILSDSTTDAEYPTLNGEPFASHFNGFTSGVEGWFVGSTEVALGMQHSYVFLTHDGGKTWAETGNVNDIWPNVLTCAIFVDDKTGFLCFRYTDNTGPLYRTENGGKTWERYEIPAVTEFLNGHGIGEVRAIRVTKENDLEMTYFASPEGNVNTGCLYTSISTDSGKTWGMLIQNALDDSPAD
jgi:hypothetical protein